MSENSVTLTAVTNSSPFQTSYDNAFSFPINQPSTFHSVQFCVLFIVKEICNNNYLLEKNKRRIFYDI